MARYPQGADVRLTATIRDATNTLANASATLISLTNPAGTVTTYTTPVNDSVGLYHLDPPHADVSTVGHYQWVWDATVGGFHAIKTDAFDVRPATEVTVLSLADAHDALNIPQTNTVDDDEILRMIAGIEAGIEWLIRGPVLNTPVTERVDMDGQPWEIKVTRRPVVSVQSVTDVATGLAVDVSALDVDPVGGFIRRKDGQAFVTNSGVVLVAYTPGLGTAVPGGVGEAAAMVLQDLWRTQRGPAIGSAFGGLDVAAQSPPWMVPLFPPKALELLAPYVRAGGVG